MSIEVGQLGQVRPAMGTNGLDLARVRLLIGPSGGSVAGCTQAGLHRLRLTGRLTRTWAPEAVQFLTTKELFLHLTLEARQSQGTTGREEKEMTE